MATGSVREKCRILFRFDARWWFFSASNQCRISIFSSDKNHFFGPPKTAMSGSALWLRRDEGAGIWPPGRSGKNVGFCSALMRDGGFLVPPINAAYRYFRRTHHFATWKKSLFWTPQNQDCSLATWGRGTRYLAMWSGGEKRRIEVRFEVGCGFFSAANRSRTSIFSSDAPFPDFKKIRLFGPAETAMSGSALWLRRDEGAGIWPPGRAVKNVRLWSSLMQTYRFLVRPVNPAHRHLHRTRGL